MGPRASEKAARSQPTGETFQSEDARITGTKTCRLGEEFAGSEKLVAEPLGYCVRVLQQVVYCANPSASVDFWVGGGSPDPFFEDRLLLLPQIIPITMCLQCVALTSWLPQCANTGQTLNVAMYQAIGRAGLLHICQHPQQQRPRAPKLVPPPSGFHECGVLVSVASHVSRLWPVFWRSCQEALRRSFCHECFPPVSPDSQSRVSAPTERCNHQSSDISQPAVLSKTAVCIGLFS